MNPIRVFILVFSLFTASVGAAGPLNLRIAGYGTYWSAEDINEGYGLGAKASAQVLGLVMLDGRAGYVNFDSFNTSVVPLELSANLRIPFLISPYAGIGAGYYLIDSDFTGSEDGTGYFGQVGADVEFGKIGIFAELRYLDLESDFLDGPSVNVGVSWKF